MVRKTLYLVLSFCLLICVLHPETAQADSTGVCFTSINDNLLELSEAPVFIGGTAYVPITVLSNKKVIKNLDVYYEYDRDIGEATLSKGLNKIIFDLNAEKVYDALRSDAGGTPAVTYNGEVYIPAEYFCNIFGIQYSYIEGSGYGDIVRLNSGALQNDEAFLTAATPVMKSYLSKAGISTPTPSTPVPATPSPSPNPTPEETIAQDLEIRDIDVYISFRGLPDDETLDLLESWGIYSCFFVSADDVRENPAMIRQLIGNGHKAGVYCGENAAGDFEQVSGLIFDAARAAVFMVSSDYDTMYDCQDMAENNSLVYWQNDLYIPGEASISDALSELDGGGSRADVCFECSDNTSLALRALLNHIYLNKYDVIAVRETNYK